MSISRTNCLSAASFRPAGIHLSGAENPPKAGKRSHWIGKTLPASADDWFAKATEQPGSWWPAWYGWLAPLSGKKVAAPRGYGDRSHKVIEPAPGRYVKAKA